VILGLLLFLSKRRHWHIAVFISLLLVPFVSSYVVFNFSGYTFEAAREDGWIIPLRAYENKVWDQWSLLDFSSIDWPAIAKGLPYIFVFLIITSVDHIVYLMEIRKAVGSLAMKFDT
jgi:hypothetical protein